ncbi:MAG: acetyl-CoA C-acetyltransferase [Oscillospiraceae bacterium]|nr:acetyl-CoA C-acetyltransferase [Oscillospiraceae bacterium]
MNKVYIVSAKRSAIGSMLGSLRDATPTYIGSEVLKAALTAGKVQAEWLDEVIVGNVLPAGLGQGPGRQVAIAAGVPVSVPAYSLNMVCGSGMKAVINAASAIQAGKADLIAAGGTEIMSAAPYLVSGKTRSGCKMGDMKMIDHMIFDALTDAYGGMHMGITAENVAERYGITRAMQDEFAIASQQKAIAAQDAGKFVDEIVPLTVKQGRKEIVFAADEYINRSTTLEKLGTLRPAFKKDGTVTAGNASGINDGASFLILASEKAVQEHDLKPLAELVGCGQGGVEPDVMGLGPVPAIANALKDADMKLSQMEVLELNEAFAAQSLGVVKLLAEQHDLTEEEIKARTNLNGGAIALGHPVGASGNRIIVTLLHELIHSGKEYGLASLCIGGGMGTAVVLKRL